jgi:hypothetical protein
MSQEQDVPEDSPVDVHDRHREREASWRITKTMVVRSRSGQAASEALVPSTASDRFVELRALDAQHAPKVGDKASGATGNCGGMAGGGIERLPTSQRLCLEHLDPDKECAVAHPSLTGVGHHTHQLLVELREESSDTDEMRGCSCRGRMDERTVRRK